MNNQIPAVPASTIGVWASLKYVVVTSCNVIVRACSVVETSLDATQDIADTAKIYTSQVKQEAAITAKAQIAQLTLETNSDTVPTIAQAS